MYSPYLLDSKYGCCPVVHPTKNASSKSTGSGSLLCCVLADNAVDFLRLLAIGYDEICWDEEFATPPSANSGFKVAPNVAFQEWVKTTFNVTIPETALEIVKHPAQIGDEDSANEFCAWCRQFQA